MLGPYRVEEELGEGGMGEVYKARDTRLDRIVALKILPPAFAADPERLRRFEQEARAVAALDDPNILVVHDVGSHEGLPYLVTELLEGESLRQTLPAGRCPCARRSTTGCRWRAASPPRTRRASSTAISSPRTCSSPGPGG